VPRLQDTEVKAFMNKIQAAFAGGRAVIPFITCGDPTLETTEQLIYAAAEGGASLIMLGIPFSDPTAEAPILQEAAIRALSGGVTTDGVFAMVRKLHITIPIVVQTYANVVFSYGAEKFISTCREIGIEGLFVPDVPFAEKEEFAPLCQKYGLSFISMVAPAPGARIAEICRAAEGFIYAAAKKNEMAALLEEIRKNTKLPCVIPEGSAVLAADGVIADSAAVNCVTEYGQKAPEFLRAYIRDFITE